MSGQLKASACLCFLFIGLLSRQSAFAVHTNEDSEIADEEDSVAMRERLAVLDAQIEKQLEEQQKLRQELERQELEKDQKRTAMLIREGAKRQEQQLKEQDAESNRVLAHAGDFVSTEEAVIAHAYDLASRFGVRGGVTQSQVAATLFQNRELRDAVFEHMHNKESDAAKEKLLIRAQPSLMGRKTNLDGTVSKKERSTVCFCAITGHKDTDYLEEIELIRFKHQSLSGSRCSDKCFFLCQLDRFVWNAEDAAQLGEEAEKAARQYTSIPGRLWGAVFGNSKDVKAATCEDDRRSNSCGCIDKDKTKQIITMFNTMLEDIVPKGMFGGMCKSSVDLFRNGSWFSSEEQCLEQCKGDVVCNGIRGGHGQGGISGQSVCVDEFMDHQ